MLKSRLGHVFWMGGSPCAGKSSIAGLLAERHGMAGYACDDAFYRHLKSITPSKQPTFYRVMHLSCDDLWMRPVEQQVAEELEIYREEFEFILADLLAMPDDRPILAEGAALLPELVAPFMTGPQQAIWVVPAVDFQLSHYRQREWRHQVLKDCSNPEQAFRNWMARDTAFAAYVAADAAARGLRVLVVDGQQSIEQNVMTVESWFQTGLAAAFH